MTVKNLENDNPKNLEEENKLLFCQLTVVQEELEQYFIRCKDLEFRNLANASHYAIKWVDDALHEALTENHRLEALTQVQCEVKSIENKNSINSRLGNIFVKANGSVGGISNILLDLIHHWRLLSRKSVPKALGGKDYNKAIEAFENKGITGVEDLLGSVELPCFLKANTYTSVARHLIRKNPRLAADFAFKAFEEDPKPYRLKWLACRLGEANDFLRADAMLELLPADMTYSDSEQRQIEQIRAEAKNSRTREASQKTKPVRDSIYRLSAEKAGLILERDQLSQRLVELQNELERARQYQVILQEENAAEKAGLILERDQLSQRLVELQNELERALQQKAMLSEEKEKLVQESAVFSNVHQLMQEEIVKADAQLDLIKDMLLRESRL